MRLKKPEPHEIAGHEYDGIHELDNPLPRWWLISLYLTIVFSLIYFAYYTLGPGPDLNQELQTALQRLEEKTPHAAGGPDLDEVRLAALSQDPHELKEGQAVFEARCVSCHGSKGEGLIGPNLTDSFWIHGKGDLKDIARTIRDGVSDKGMPPWGGMLKKDELYDVAAYVKSLHGTNPPNPKAPQGNEVKD